MIGIDLAYDLYPLLAGVCAAVACGLLGNFLLLRKLSLMGDAISHSVLPGLVIAFIIAGTREPMLMMIGAGAAGIVTVALVEVIKRLGRVEPGAAMGVVFCILFALGVLLIERADVRQVDMDADCVLYGDIESLGHVRAPATLGELFDGRLLLGYTLAAGEVDPYTGRRAFTDAVHTGIPRQVVTLGVVTVLAFVFVGVLFKELRIASFDPALATTLGFSAAWLHYLLMVFVAIATVASFEAVGSILVIAMLICPAAVARLLTDRLLPQLAWSVVVAAASAVGGFYFAEAIPALFDKDAVNIAGSMAVMAGVFVMLGLVASPSHGIVARSLRRRRLAVRVAQDDLLGLLYRARECGESAVTLEGVAQLLAGQPWNAAVRRCIRNGLAEKSGTGLTLTPTGTGAAAEHVRRHRLWERYLVDEAGLAPDHVHAPAELLEHTQTEPPGGFTQDPHGRSIPASPADDERRH